MEIPDGFADQTEKRTWITSPSCIRYSLPSTRPASAEAYQPAICLKRELRSDRCGYFDRCGQKVHTHRNHHSPYAVCRSGSHWHSGTAIGVHKDRNLVSTESHCREFFFHRIGVLPWHFLHRLSTVLYHKTYRCADTFTYRCADIFHLPMC